MITVHKYTFPIDDVVDVHTHVGAEMLTVAVQNGVPVLWARVDTDKPPHTRRLRIAGTGHPNAVGAYLGTLIAEGGLLHVFDLDVPQ